MPIEKSSKQEVLRKFTYILFNNVVVMAFFQDAVVIKIPIPGDSKQGFESDRLQVPGVTFLSGSSLHCYEYLYFLLFFHIVSQMHC